MKTLKTPKLLIAGLILATLSACGQAPNLAINADTLKPASDSTSTPTTTDAAPVATGGSGTTTVAAATSTTVTGFYYTKTKSEAPIGGWPTKTYTAQGSCLAYLSKTYCWDDGLKVLQWSSGGNNYGPYGYTYFGVGTIAGGAQTFQGHGALVSDLATSARVISATMESNMLVASATVLSTGTPTAITCQATAALLDCGTFSIDLTQVPL